MNRKLNQFVNIRRRIKIELHIRAAGTNIQEVLDVIHLICYLVVVSRNDLFKTLTEVDIAYPSLPTRVCMCVRPMNVE